MGGRSFRSGPPDDPVAEWLRCGKARRTSEERRVLRRFAAEAVRGTRGDKRQRKLRPAREAARFRHSEARNNEGDSDPGGKQVRAIAGRPEHGEFLRAGPAVTSSALNKLGKDLVVDLCARILGDLDLQAPREGSRTEKKHN